VYIDDGGESGSAAVTISNSTIVNNTAANADDPGVGISVAGGSTLDLIQSTVTGNHHVGAPQERDLGALYLQGGSYTPDAAGNSAHVQGKHGKPDSEVHAAEAGAPANVLAAKMEAEAANPKIGAGTSEAGEETAVDVGKRIAAHANASRKPLASVK